MTEYKFVSVGAGEVDLVCNKWSREGWTVDKLYKENNKFYLLFIRAAPKTPAEVGPPKSPAPVRGRPRIKSAEEQAMDLEEKGEVTDEV